MGADNHVCRADVVTAAESHAERSGIWTTPDGIEVIRSNHRRFVDAMGRARNMHPRTAFVSPKTAASLRKSGAAAYLLPDGAAGYYMNPDGYVGGLFSDGTRKGVGRVLLVHAIEHGAEALDCFSGENGGMGYLDTLYSGYGFKEVARYPFSEESAPGNWDYQRDGTPDYVDMVWAGGDRAAARQRYIKDQAIFGK